MAKVRIEAIKADDYKMLELKQQIMKNPDMYIGSCKKLSVEEWIFDKKMEKQTISLPDGISRLFLEIVSNACDATSRFKMAKGGDTLNIHPITVKMTTDEITVTNYGHKDGIYLIPIEINKQTQMYAPEMIFGNLLTSSNYDDKVIRTGVGKNGYGAKLVNIFSKLFKVVVIDHSRKLKYSQKWEQNMEIKHEPIIEECLDDYSSISISYSLDFKRFDYTKYPEEAFKLFRRYCADFSLGIKTPIIFNGTTIDCSDINTFSKLFFSEEILKNSILNKIYPIRLPNGIPKKISMMYPESEFMIIYTPDSGCSISLVNGLMTKYGGCHVAEAYKKISEILLPKINKENSSLKITMADIKRHITIILSCRLHDPTYTSQSKTCLSDPVPNLEIEKSNIPKIMEWGLLQDLKDVLDFKGRKELKKTDGKKVRHTNIEKITDANYAGTKRSNECTLILIEGQSAGSYATGSIDIIPDGKDYYGTFPLKGKLLNVREASVKQLLENTEIGNLKKTLGLKEETNYLLDENFEDLRYGQLYIMVDADVDGKHIAGLIYNYFEVFYPSLLKREFVKYYRTPILRVEGPKIKEVFYNEYDFEKWANDRPKNYTVEYYKGLGSSSDENIKEDSKRVIITTSVYDPEASKNLKLAFDSNFTDVRKELIKNWFPKGISLETQTKMNISDFMNEEFITYSIANVERSLPCLFDGLKESQRKLLWTFLDKFKGCKNDKRLKTVDFGNSTSSYTNYHHGEKSLCSAINVMTNYFVGSNNMPYFQAAGQFGKRNEGGKDAAHERYTYVKSMWWLKYIFRDEDLPILKFVEDEGSSWEPENFLPIIPMSLVNGARGIGTGNSTFIPCHNPLDICRWIKNRITENKKLPVLKPWYRGFIGKIEFKNIEAEELREKMLNNSDLLEDPDFVSEDFVFPKNVKINAMVSKGSFDILEGKKENNIRITEVPIGIWYKPYLKKIKKDLLDTKIVKDILVKSRKNDNDNYEYELVGVQPGFVPTLENLSLTNSFSVGNMVLLNEKKRPKKFKTVEEILETFFVYRLGKYSERKQKQIDIIEKEIVKMNNKIRFIKAELDGKIVIRKMKRDIVLKNMESMGFEKELLTSCNIGSFTNEGVIDLEQKVLSLEKEKEDLRQTKEENIWLSEIEEFLKEYKKHYKC